MLNIQQLQHPLLCIDNWQVAAGQSWAVLGRNGAGKQVINQLLQDKLENGRAQVLQKPAEDKLRIISFENQQALYEHELKIDQTDITDEIDPGTLVRQFLPEQQLEHPLIDSLNLRHRMHTGYRQLSSGECCKVLLLQAILQGVELLVLDNPFDNLDINSRQELIQSLQQLPQQGISLIFLLSNRQDIPHWTEQLALVEQQQLQLVGDYQSPLAKQKLQQLFASQQAKIEWPVPLQAVCTEQPLVKLSNCRVTYDGKAVLNQFNLEISPLQHTLITGPNGSGKSTLLQLITGDCPQCYSNDVQVFGHQRGSGETIWDIKQHFGLVSPELHRQYRVKCSALVVVLSGLFDSIGLYQQISKQQSQLALQYLQLMGLESFADTRFQQLSQGQQRQVLIARALIKSPKLLILDEPTQGLDEVNRKKLLEILEIIANSHSSTLLMVSHRQDEYLPLFSQLLDVS